MADPVIYEPQQVLIEEPAFVVVSVGEQGPPGPPGPQGPAGAANFGGYDLEFTTPVQGDVVYFDGTKWVNRRVLPRVVSVTGAAGGTITPNADLADQYEITALGADATIANPAGTPTNGQRLMIRFKDNGTGRSLSWGSSYRAFGTTLPAITVSGKGLYVGCIYNAQDAFWDVVAISRQV